MDNQKLRKQLELKNVPFVNFSDGEMQKITEYIEENKIDLLNLDFPSICADIVGRSVGLAVTPKGFAIIGF